MRLSPTTARVLTPIATIALAIAAAAFVTGGYDLHIGPIELSIHAAWRPLLVGVTCLAGLAAIRRGRSERSAELDRTTGGWFLAGAATFVVLVVIAQGSFVAAGSDASGYVSQSKLWSDGQLRVPQPLADWVSWPEREWTFSPLGYRPATVRSHMVPTYAPGLPLMMALARIIGGESALYLVVPLSGVLLLVATCGLGVEPGGATAGLLAVTLITLSPTFLRMVVQPMSDVPAGAFWATALLLACRARSSRGAALAGVVAALAVTIRPNLVPLAAVVGTAVLVDGDRQNRFARASAFALGLLPGPLAVALIQWHL